MTDGRELGHEHYGRHVVHQRHRLLSPCACLTVSLVAHEVWDPEAALVRESGDRP